MDSTLENAAELQMPARKGGLLESALSVPRGWTQGLSIPFYGCGEPLLQDRCVTANDTVHRTSVASFYPFGISQGAACSTLSRLDQKKHAVGRLDATTEWAVARQLATDSLGLGTPSFEDGTSLGTVADGNFALAGATLEQAAADAGFGTLWWLHTSIKGAVLAKANGLFNDDFESPTGALWVVSPGYPVPGPTTVRMWATGPVFAGVEEPFTMNNVDWHVNEDTAFANRQAIVAFDPCINLYIDVTIPASPTP